MNPVILQILKERVNEHHICHPLFQYFAASILECENVSVSAEETGILWTFRTP